MPHQKHPSKKGHGHKRHQDEDDQEENTTEEEEEDDDDDDDSAPPPQKSEYLSQLSLYLHLIPLLPHPGLL